MQAKNKVGRPKASDKKIAYTFMIEGSIVNDLLFKLEKKDVDKKIVNSFIRWNKNTNY